LLHNKSLICTGFLAYDYLQTEDEKKEVRSRCFTKFPLGGLGERNL